MSVADTSSGRRCVMLTGASGFIGSHVLRALAQRDVRAIAVVRPESRSSTSRAVHACAANVVECDLLNPMSVEAVVTAHRPSACIHAAWDVARPDYLTHPDNQRWVQASLHLASCLKANGCRWLGVVGTYLEPTGSAQPPNRYAAAKVTFRHRLTELAGESMSVCWWRLFQPYGPGERESRLIPSMLKSFGLGMRYLVKQPEARRDFIHVEDVAAAIIQSFERSIGGLFDLGSGSLHRLHEVANRMSQAMNSEHLLEFSPLEFTTPESAHPADIAALRVLADWSPRISLDAGLHALAAAARTPLRATA